MCDCDHIFPRFRWERLVSIHQKQLPNRTGVYVIRIRKRGIPISEVISHTENLVNKIEWTAFKEYVLNRVNRVENISECPVVYIGAAPTSLRNRYKDLCGRRHTAFFPILTLLMNDWELDFGWLPTDKPREMEKSLKDQYIQIHDALPALVKR